MVLESWLVGMVLLSWPALGLLVLFDAAARSEKHVQWGVVVALMGVFGFAVYLLFVVHPPSKNLR